MRSVVARPERRSVSCIHPLEHHLLHALGGLGVEMSGGLVEKEDPWLQEQRPRQADNLSLAPGKDRRALIQESGRLPHLREQCGGPALPLASCGVDMETQREVEVLEYGAGNQDGLLLHVHHARPESRELLSTYAVPTMMNVAFVRTIEAAKGTEQ